MLKIRNKKIAILGSSPVMLILFYFLKKNNNVFIFDDNELIGGAWRKKFYKKTSRKSFGESTEVRYTSCLLYSTEISPI